MRSGTQLRDHVLVLIAAAIAYSALPHAAHAAASTVRVATDLTRPLFVTAPPGDADRLFIVEQAGLIKILRDGVVLSRPFLDIRSIVDDAGFEQGLLGLAFAPDYSTSGLLYVYFTWDPGPGNDVSRLRRYQVSVDPDSADTSSGFEIMRVTQDFANHNGGTIAFGSDGFLYWGLGDGGSGGDPNDRAQDPLSLLGKMLRIHPGGDDFPADPNQNYSIPPNNPFVLDAGTRDEIWALGLRNPYRWSFDRATGDLYIGDVGQSTWEEINWQAAASAGGENYGWRCYEGNHVFNLVGCGPIGKYKFPVHEYDHATDGSSCSVTGGAVYRGSEVPSLVGRYLFADFCSRQIYSFEVVGGAMQNLQNRTVELAPGGGQIIAEISAIAEDGVGEMYIVDLGRNTPPGEVYKIVRDPTDVGDNPPSLDVLSQAIPNPFSGHTTFELSDAAREEPLQIVVFDVAGRRVRRLVDGSLTAGPTHLVWNGRDDGARPAPAGIYFVRVLAADGRVVATRKVVLTR